MQVGKSPNLDQCTRRYPEVSTGCDTGGNVAALTADSMNMVLYDVVEEIRMKTFKLPMPGEFVAIRMINESAQDEVVVVTHENHISILRFGDFVTMPYPVKKATSLFIVKNLACVIPDVNQTAVNVVCVDVIEHSYKECPVQVAPKSYGYSDRIPHGSIKDIALIITPSDPAYLREYSVKDGCIEFLREGKNVWHSSRAWFSYNGSLIYIDEGYIVPVNNLQMSAGYFYGSLHYLWFSQFPDGDHRIAAIRSGSENSDKIFYFSWPHHDPADYDRVSIPPNYNIVSTDQVHACSQDLEYAIVTYKDLRNGQLQTGVAYLKFF